MENVCKTYEKGSNVGATCMPGEVEVEAEVESEVELVFALNKK